MNLHAKLIPSRFLCLLAHLIAVIMIYYTRSANLRASIPATDYSTWNSKDSELLAALWLCLICFMIEFAGLFLGISLFLVRYNAFSTVAHFAGALLCCWYIVDTWFYSTFWYIWIFFSMLPALGEGIAFLRVFCCRAVEY